MKVRDAFFYEIYKQVRKGEDIVIVSADIGAPSLDKFRRDFPNRFINVGIAEQNLIAVASGLQLSGKKVVAYGLNPFPVTRAFDQIRNLMASLQIPITLTALNAGTCSADAGYTHMPIENIAMVRSLKNISIINPSDEIMVKGLVQEIIQNPKPRYVQFDKSIEGKLYEENDICFKAGLITNKKSSEVVVVATGVMAYGLMEKEMPVKVIDCFSLPISSDLFIKEVCGCKQIVTVEDGMVTGGIGSMVLEILNDFQMNIPVKRLGLNFRKGYPDTYTNRELILEQEGLTLEDIRCCVNGMLEEKI